LQLTEDHSPCGGVSNVPQRFSPTNILAPLSLSPQQSPLFKIYTFVTVYSPPNLAFHHGPSLSFIVQKHVNYSAFQLALNLANATGFQARFSFPLQCPIELVVIQSS